MGYKPVIQQSGSTSASKLDVIEASIFLLTVHFPPPQHVPLRFSVVDFA